MVSYFGLRVRDVDCLDPDDVSKKLTSLGLLTTEWLNILLESRIEWFIRNIAASKTFNVASIIPTPEVAIAIDTEYRAEINYDDKSNPVLEFVMGLEDAPEIIEKQPILSDLDDLSAPVLEESNELPAPPEEIILEEIVPVSNNNQIEETNESTDIDWF
jgi:hypothetical protein